MRDRIVLLVLAGCWNTPPNDRGPFNVDVCSAEGSYVGVDGLTHEGRLLDYAELRKLSSDDGDAAIVAETSGVRCRTATNRSACEEAFSKLPPSDAGFCFPSPLYRNNADYQLAWTQGDNVGVVTTREDLRAFLTVDGPKNAALILMAFEPPYWIPCNGPNARKTSAGWLIRAHRAYAECRPEETALLIKRDGAIEDWGPGSVVDACR